MNDPTGVRIDRWLWAGSMVASGRLSTFLIAARTRDGAPLPASVLLGFKSSATDSRPAPGMTPGEL